MVGRWLDGCVHPQKLALRGAIPNRTSSHLSIPPTQARVYSLSPNFTWEWRPDLVVIGNTTNANGGCAEFQGLQVAAPPGSYQLRFSPTSPQQSLLAPATLDLRLRGCVAGEANLTTQAAGRGSAAALAPCQECRPGSISLDPLASGGCTRCGDSLHANCTGFALVPNSGYYHSHPRSPLVHRCLLAAACQGDARQGDMQAWAQRHARGRLGGPAAAGPSGVHRHAVRRRLPGVHLAFGRDMGGATYAVVGLHRQACSAGMMVTWHSHVTFTMANTSFLPGSIEHGMYGHPALL